MGLEKSYLKFSNLFLFVSDLSQWNSLTYSPQRKEKWVRITGKLNSEEKNKLKQFSGILQQAEDNLELEFLFRNSATKSTLKNQKEIEEIFKILSHFESRFDLIWKSEKKKLKAIAGKISLDNPQIKENLKIIKNLCGLSESQLPEKIILKLLISVPKECQAWSFTNTIALECSGLNEEISCLYNIFLHECFHILLKQNEKLFNNFLDIIAANRNTIEKNGELKIWGAEIVFEEALISSFLPEGYLGQKIGFNCQKNNKVNILEKLRNFCQFEIFDSAKDYVENSRGLDKNYFLKIEKTIKYFIEKNKR